MIWPWSKKRQENDIGDIETAKQMRNELGQEKWELQLQRPEVESLVRKLKRRRELNHFGEELSVSFHPRRVV